MLLNSNSKIVSTKKNSENLDDFLQKEKAQNKSKPWSKLGRSTKLKKLEVFVTQFAIEKKLTDAEKKQLHSYLNTSLDRKKLQRVKDVNYDVKTGRIKAIPGLTYNKNKRERKIKLI